MADDKVVGDKAAGNKGQSRALGRSAARLAAVQALYQLAGADAAPETVIQEFISFRIGKELEGFQYPEADEGHFKSVVAGAVERRGELDTMIGEALAEGWTVQRLGQLMRSLLAAAAFELVGRPDVPVRVIINEYVELARDFYDDKEVAFVNGVLDHLAKRARPGELPER